MSDGCYFCTRTLAQRTWKGFGVGLLFGSFLSIYFNVFPEVWFSLGGGVGFWWLEFDEECFERPQPWDPCSVVMGKCLTILKMSRRITFHSLFTFQVNLLRNMDSTKKRTLLPCLIVLLAFFCDFIVTISA